MGNLGIEYYAFALFIAGLICVVAIIFKVLFSNVKRANKMLDEREKEILQTYNAVETIMEEFQDQAKATIDELNLREQEYRAAMRNMAAFQLPPELEKKEQVIERVPREGAPDGNKIKAANEVLARAEKLAAHEPIPPPVKAAPNSIYSAGPATAPGPAYSPGAVNSPGSVYAPNLTYAAPSPAAAANPVANPASAATRPAAPSFTAAQPSAHAPLPAVPPAVVQNYTYTPGATAASATPTPAAVPSTQGAAPGTMPEAVPGNAGAPQQAQAPKPVVFQKFFDDAVEAPPPTPYTPAAINGGSRRDAILALAAEGKSDVEIASSLGITRNEVQLVIGLTK